jgi:hypothetical protein
MSIYNKLKVLCSGTGSIPTFSQISYRVKPKWSYNTQKGCIEWTHG